jgi:hypothetical protein
MPPVRKSGGQDPAGRAARAFERGATAVGITVARSLYGRWRRMPPEQRARIERLAENVKGRALDLSGEPNPRAARQDLQDANERLAEAMVESAAKDPEITEIEVSDLRADLARELERLADGDIRASRGSGSVPGEAASADGQA